MGPQGCIDVLGQLATGDLTDADVLVLADAYEEVGDTERAALLRTVDYQNKVRSAREVRLWHTDPPDNYFAYVKVEGCSRDGRRGRIITWMGDPLGDCTLGRAWRDNFGGLRRSIRCVGTNGVTYSGTYFHSAGDYCRIKRVKG